MGFYVKQFTINSDLGRVCQVIIREFEKNPPELAAAAASKPPPELLHSSIPELAELDDNQLKELLKDDQYMDDLIENLTPIKTLNAKLDVLFAETCRLASENLEYESRLIELKSSVETLSSEFIDLGKTYHQTSQKYEEKASEYKPENIQHLLQIGIANAEANCEEIIEKFLDGQLPLSNFLENFMEIKKLIATRKFKEERLNLQLNQMKL